MNHHFPPPETRNAGRDRATEPGWDALSAELDAWSGAGRVATLWWRDDDATDATGALARLLALSEGHHVPLALAVIPDAARPALATALTDSPAPVTVVQHGYAHRSHAPAGEKAAEIGDHRPAAAVAAELSAGRERLATLFGDRFLPLMVPPWNRIGTGVETILAGFGFLGPSTFGPRRPGETGRANAHIDIVDWRGTRGFAGEAACLGAAIGHLADRRSGRSDPTEPTGLLTHHLVHDEACWGFIDGFLATTTGHRAVEWLSPGAIFGGARA